MEQLPKIVRERLAATARPGVHPDPDLLTAFAENSLPERERGTVLNHLAQCAECREAIAVAAPQMELELVAAAAVPDAASPVPRRPSWLRAPALRWATVAASVIVVGAAVLAYRETAEKRGATHPAEYEAELKTTPSPAVAKLEPAGKPPAAPSAGTRNSSSDEARSRESQVARFPETAVPEPAKKAEVAGSRDLSASAAAAAPRVLAPPSANEARSGSEAHPADALIAGNLVAARPQAPSRNAPSEELKQELRKDKDAASRNELQPSPAAPPPPADEVVATAPAANPSTTETVTVETLAAKPAAARAKTAARSGAASGAFAGVAQYSKERNLDLARANSNIVTPRWVLSNDGTMLLRSDDDGKTWQTITVANHVVLLSVNAFGPQVWAGGGGGALYHSVDEGAHWTQIKPVANGAPLSDDITQIHFRDALHGQLTTLHHQVWTTADGGQTWQTP
jgi:Putative zinc-finger